MKNKRRNSAAWYNCKQKNRNVLVSTVAHRYAPVNYFIFYLLWWFVLLPALFPWKAQVFLTSYRLEKRCVADCDPLHHARPLLNSGRLKFMVNWADIETLQTGELEGLRYCLFRHEDRPAKLTLFCSAFFNLIETNELRRVKKHHLIAVYLPWQWSAQVQFLFQYWRSAWFISIVVRAFIQLFYRFSEFFRKHNTSTDHRSSIWNRFGKIHGYCLIR